MQLSSSRTLPRHGSALSRVSAASLSGRMQAIGLCQLGSEVAGQHLDVAGAFAQRRQGQR